MNKEFAKESLVRIFAREIEDMLAYDVGSVTIYTSDLEEFDGLTLLQSMRLLDEAIRDYREYHQINMRNYDYGILLSNGEDESLKINIRVGAF